MLPSLSSVICEQTLQQRHGAPRAWKCNAGVSVFQCWFYLLTFVLTSAVWLEYYLVRAELKHFCCINPALGNMTLKATYNHVHALSEPPCVMHWENPVIWKHNAAEKQKHKWWIFNGLFSLACLTGFLVMALLSVVQRGAVQQGHAIFCHDEKQLSTQGNAHKQIQTSGVYHRSLLLTCLFHFSALGCLVRVRCFY